VIRFLVVCVVIGASCVATRAASIEHWTCQERLLKKEYPQEYTLADNRMFAPKGKGSWPLIYNNDQVAIAYLRLQTDSSPATTHVYVLDKLAGKLILYDDTRPVAAEHWSHDVEPGILISPCKRLD
jgi:hypothetical protein